MAVMSKMERMLHERKEDNIDPVLDEYSSPGQTMKFSTRFVLIMCAIVFFFIVAMFLPLQNQVLIWVRAGFLVTTVLAVVALLLDRSTHLHH